MNQIGRKLYYEKETGNIILNTGEQKGSAVETTVQQDFESYKALSERNPETVGVIHLPYGAFSQDFQIATSVRIDPESKSILFAYPDPNNLEKETVHEKPLSGMVKELERENTLLKAQNKALTDRTDFHEEVLTEIIMTIHS